MKNDGNMEKLMAELTEADNINDEHHQMQNFYLSPYLNKFPVWWEKGITNFEELCQYWIDEKRAPEFGKDDDLLEPSQGL